MSKKEKLLSDKILDLINPTPVHFDPEADIHTETAAKVVDNDFDDDDLSDDGALSIFRKRNVQLIEEVDKRYAGKKVTRESIGSFPDKRSKESSSSGDDDDEQSENEDDVNSENEDDNSGDEEGENESDGSKEDISGDESGDESGSDDSEGGEDLSGVEVEDSDGDGNDANISKDFVHLATKDKGAEIEKGNAIRTQLSLWDGLLEARISLQKVLVAANKLPQPTEKDFFVAQGGKEFTKAAKTTQKAVSKLLDKLIDLRELRLKSNSEAKSVLGDSNGEAKTKNESEEEITSSEDEETPEKETEAEEPKEPTRKRKLEDYATELAEQHAKFAAYRNSTIQRWNDKTRVSMGKIGGRDFSGFEQPTLRQIEQIMSNMPRLVARTRVKRTPFRSLGKPAAFVDDPTQPPPEEADREIFDDSDFYHVQLRELIERKTGSEPMGRQWLAVQAARSKMKRKCDTTATKGRRLRYTPHAKLLSFMAPIPELPCNFDARNELYLSLFGAKRV